MRRIENIEVVVLVGCYSTRLRYVIGKKRHKCMVEVNGRTFLEQLIEELRDCDLRNFIFLTGHGGEEVAVEARRVCRKYKLKCQVVEDKEISGTVNALKSIKSLLGAEFFVVNGDTLSLINYNEMLYQHRSYASSPLATFTVSDYGSNIIGAFLFSKNIFSWLEKCSPANIDYEFFSKLMCDRELVHIVRSTKPFFDIGTVEGLQRYRKWRQKEYSNDHFAHPISLLTFGRRE